MATNAAPRHAGRADPVERPRLFALLDRGARARSRCSAPGGERQDDAAVVVAAGARTPPSRGSASSAARPTRRASGARSWTALRALGRGRAGRPARHARAGAGGRAGGVPRAAARGARPLPRAGGAGRRRPPRAALAPRRSTASSSCSRARPRSCARSSLSRRDPKLGLHRLRLAGELAEIRAADLEFTAEETRRAAGGGRASRSTPSDVGRLHERTEGWAAGLRLAAMSLARHDAPGALRRRVLRAASARSPTTCSARCSTASRPRCARCCCAPASSSASTARSPTC